MSKVTFTDKQDLIVSNFPDVNKITAIDINSIKEVVNSNDDAKTEKGGYQGTSNDLKNAIDNAVFDGAKTYQTEAELLSVSPIPSNGTPAKVANNVADSAKNGNWSVVSGAWVQNSSVISNITNSEDIKTVGDELQFVDRNKTVYSLGYKIIRSDFDFTAIPADYDNSIWEIRNFHDLLTNNIILPSNVTLKFNGGKLGNGTLTGSNTTINGNKCLSSDIVLSGTYSSTTLDTRWYGLLNTNFTIAELNTYLSIDFFKSIFIESNTYVLNGTIQNLKAKTIVSNGELTFDFSLSTFSDGVIIGELSYLDIETISTTIPKNTKQYTFSNSSHGLLAGDVVNFIDDADGSYVNYRTYYKKGEFKKVLSVSGAVVTFDRPIYFSYASGDKISKVNMLEFNNNTQIKIIAPNLTSSFALKIVAIKDSFIGNISVNNGSYSCVTIAKCFNLTFSNTNQRGVRSSGSFTDYGVLLLNCNKVSVKGHFISARHALSTSGNSNYPAVTNLDINVEGIYETNEIGGTSALNTHGNIEKFIFNGIVNGGVSLGGEKSKFNAIIHAASDGRTVYFAELSGYNHDFSGCQHYGNDYNPETDLRGVIDLGGNTVPNSGVIYTKGVLNFSNSTIDAPSANILIKLRNRTGGGDTSEVVLDLSNIKMLNYEGSASTPIYLRNDNAASDAFKKIMLDNIYDANEVGVNTINLAESIITENGGHISTSITLNNTVNSVSGSVNFKERRLITPNTVASIPNTLVASDAILVAISSVTNTVISYTLYTADGSNFGTNSSVDVNFIYN